jgi:ABC-type nitrate/sulfonate/bicarbonate transport system substrate-binding protein
VALLAGRADFAGTVMGTLVEAAGGAGKTRTLARTFRRPFIALVASPKAPEVGRVADLAGKRVGTLFLAGVNAMARYALQRGGVDPRAVEWVPMGNNEIDALQERRVDAAMLQEPGVTYLVRAGAKVLIDFMNPADLQTYLGGNVPFMSVSTRPELLEKRPETARRLLRALAQASAWLRATPGSKIVEQFPLVPREQAGILAEVLDRNKDDLYPTDMALDAGDVQRMVDVLRMGGLPADLPVPAADLFSNDYLAP